eukprot:scaffold1.g5433.t1
MGYLGAEEAESYFAPLSSAAHSTAASGATGATPTKLATQEIYRRWFQAADTGEAGMGTAADRDGRLVGADAVRFFERSGLPREALAKVWAHADNKRQGFLDLPAFIRALELVSLAQSTGEVSLDSWQNAKGAGIPPPAMRGLEPPPPPPAHLQHKTPPPPGAAAAAGAPDSNPFSAVAGAGGPGAGGGEAAALAGADPFLLLGGDLLGGPMGAPSPAASSGQQQQQQQQPGYPPASAYGYGTPGGYGAPPTLAMPPPMPPPTMHSPYGQPSPQAAGSGFFGRRKQKRLTLSTKDVTSITDGLRRIYFQRIRPLEEMYKFGHFFRRALVPLLSEGDFEAKPSVLLLGQYSTGGSRMTSEFVVVVHGPEERRTPGNTLFGNGFLSKFECAACDNRLLEEISLVDTPGVLSGEKQRIERTYDFIQARHSPRPPFFLTGVCGWFAARCDLILLLFDPYKLDISDEFKQVISTLKGHDDKVRVVLNKADQVDQQQLMRVYGALMWSLGKVFRSPEVCRVYIGSFNASQPIREDVNPSCKALFEKEQEDLLHDLYDIPARSCDRKVNEFVKRVRAAKIHFLIMGHLRKQMPYFGQKKAQARAAGGLQLQRQTVERLMDNLVQEFLHVQREYHLHPGVVVVVVGDFPDVNRYREILSAFDLGAFPKLDKAMVKQARRRPLRLPAGSAGARVDDALSIDIPALVRQMENPYL